MSSGPLIALEQQLTSLKGFFVVQKSDYSLYTAEDHAKALAFRLQASACIEDYVERRCLEVARIGADRMSKGQPTATGRALVASLIVRKSSRAIPLNDTDVLAHHDLIAVALGSYVERVKSSHGISGRDLRELVFPLGLRDVQVPQILVDGLNDLSKARDPASHVYINRAKTMTEPIAEWNRVDQLMPYLRRMDDDLGSVAEQFPV